MPIPRLAAALYAFSVPTETPLFADTVITAHSAARIPSHTPPAKSNRPGCLLYTSQERDMFLDNITLEQLNNELNIDIRVVDNDGYELLDAIIGVQ